MSPERYAELKRQGYHRIPLCRTLLADTETPLSTYLKLANQPGSYLFESVVGGETWGRYSIIGLPCQQFIRVNQGVIRVENAVGDVLSEVQPNDPLAWIEQFQQQFNVPELSQLPRYYGGLVGYFGYNTIRYIEPRLGPATLPSNFDQPDILLMVSEEVVVFDNLRSQMHLVVLTDPLQANAYEQGQHRLTTLHQELCAAAPVVANYALPDAEPALPELTSNLSFEQYSQALAQAKSYILNGDIMQVVFARELAGELNVSALELYRALRHLNPAPYLYYLSYPDGFQVVGSSPEILARVENRRVTVRPIAGTRPRGQDVAEDLALEHELLHDPKEIAEHLMLIDLGRNDVSRVAEVGSVKLTEKMVIERYSQVMHIVSNVEAILKSGCSAMDVLKATFPAGTVTGAPKIRAMEIIDELETVKRGIYAGAVGYLAWNGNLDTAIAIRTAVVQDGRVQIQVGGGIVADSTPEGEWQETVNKSKALCKAIALAQAGVNS